MWTELAKGLLQLADKKKLVIGLYSSVDEVIANFVAPIMLDNPSADIRLCQFTIFSTV